MKAAVVEPVDVGEGGELDVVEAAPGAVAVDELEQSPSPGASHRGSAGSSGKLRWVAVAPTAQLTWFDDHSEQRTSVVLGFDPIAVPATSLILSVTGAPRARLDGQLLRPLVEETIITQLNLERSEGYHRLEVGGQTFWFATHGVKLRLDEIAKLLRDLGSLGQAWSGQLMFSRTVESQGVVYER